MAARYRMPNHVLRATVGEDEVLLDTRSNLYHLLEGTGPRVMKGLDDGKDPSAVADEIAHEHSIDASIVQRDVEGFVTSMLELGLLVHD